MQVWAVIAQKGGAGKTTLAIHISIALAGMNHSVELLDVDPQQSAARWGTGNRKKRPPLMTPIVAPQIFDMLDRIRAKNVDTVVVDTSPRADRESLIIAGAADLIIVPVRPSPLDFPAVEDTLSLLRGAGHLAKTVTVLNAVAASTDERELAAAYLSKLGPEMCPHSLGERVDFRRSLLIGQGITEAKTKSPAVKEMLAVTKWLVKRANATQEAKDGQGKSVRKAG